MDVAARMTSKGQVTVPKKVREALNLETGDSLLFRLEGDRVILEKTRNLLELVGAVRIPPGKRGASWERITSETRAERAARRR